MSETNIEINPSYKSVWPIKHIPRIWRNSIGIAPPFKRYTLKI